jgi:hypothetical protein
VTNVFRPMRSRVPGLLGDDALQQQLEIFSKQQRDTQEAAPAPNSAVDFAEGIKKKFLDEGFVHQQGSIPRRPAPAQLDNTPAARFADQTERIEENSTGLASGLNTFLRLSPAGAVGGYAVDRLVEEGTLSAEEAAAEAATRLEDAKLREQAMQNKAEVRAKLRGMTDEQAATMGLPVAPGGTPEMAAQEGTDRDLKTLEKAGERVKEAEKVAAGEAPALTQEWWLNAMQVGARSAALTGTSVLQYPLAWYELQAGFVRGNVERSEARVWLETVDAAVTKMLPGDKARSKDFLTELSSGTGSMAAFLLAGYIGSAAGLPAALASGALGASSSGMQQYKEAEQFGATGVQKFISLIAGSGLGMTEAIPIDRMLFRADQYYGGAVRRALVNTAAGSIEEFIQEFSQAVGEDITAKFTYDPERELNVKDWLKQGAIGGIIGGGAGAITTGISEAGVRATEPSAAEREQLTIAVIDQRQRDIDKALAGVPPELVADEAADIADPMLPETAPTPAPVPEGVASEAAGTAIPNVAIEAADIVVNDTSAPTLRDAVVQSPEFQNWFRDSKVVDPATGAPRVVFHGTARSGFSDFDTYGGKYGLMGAGSYFTESPSIASEYTDKGAAAMQRRGESPSPGVYAVTLSIRNPIDMDAPADPAAWQKAFGEYLSEDATGTNEQMLRALEDGLMAEQLPSYEGVEIVQTGLESMGYDGVTHMGGGRVNKDGPKHRVWVAFHPEQIKSINNRGTFDPSNPDILAQRVDALETNVQRFRGGTMPAPRADGKIELTHWSSSAREAIDPAKRGTGPLRGGERNRLIGPEAVDRSYYGVGDPDFMKKLQAENKKLKPKDRKYASPTDPYRNEGLGPFRHTVAVDPNDLYNWYEDPDNLKAGLDRTLSGPEQVTQYEKLIKDAGWRGIYMSSSPLGQTAVLFDAARPERILDERTGEEIPQTFEEFEAQLVSPDKKRELMDQIPGLRGVLRYVTEPEQKRVLKAAQAKKLVEIFEKMPDPKEMAAVAVSARAKRGWYAKSARALVDIFGVADAPRFSALLAALSPQTSVQSNAANALNVWVNWSKAGRPTDRKTIMKIMAASVEGGGTEASVLDAWVENSMRALTAVDPTQVQLSGPKVDSFMRNLNGVVNEVTNDAWMANYANVDQAVFAARYLKTPEGKLGDKGVGYIAMSAAVRRAAKVASDLTGETWTPAEIQETVWSWAKTLYEKAGAKGEIRTAEEILAAGGLTAEDIASTPDFAALFASGIYRNILEKGGYDVSALESGGQSDGGDGPRGPVGSAEGSGFAQDAFSRHLRRAARRLDALRAARAEAEQARGAPAAETLTLEETFFPTTSEALPRWWDDFGPDESAFDAQRVEQPVTIDDFQNLTPEVLRRPGWAILTGTQEVAGDPLAPANVEANARLREELGDAAIEIGGSYQGLDQGSSFVVFMDPQQALEIGARYGQESILTNKGLEYIDGRVVPAVPAETVVGDEAKALDFFSTLPDGTSFSVGLDFGAMFTPEEALAGGTAANRNAFKAEQTRPAAGVPLPPDAKPAEVSLAKIANNVVKTLDLTARQGRFTLKGSDVMGQYSRKQAVVRLRTWNDLSSLVHEGGHALHDAASAQLKTFERAHETELKKIADDLYGGNTAQLNSASHIREGFAEFFRVFVLNRSFAATKYPTVTTAFEAELGRFAPQMLEALNGVGDQFAAWLQMPSAQLINSMVVPGVRNTGIDAAIEELRAAGFKSWYQEYARKAVEVTINQFAPLNEVVNQILNNAQAASGKAIDLKVADDPRKLARLARNAGARAMVQLTDGVMPYRSVQPASRGLREALMLSQGVPEGTSPRRIDEARALDFDSYLVALRARDEYRRLDEGKIDRPPLNATLGDVNQAIADLETKYGQSFLDAAAVVHEFGMALWKKQYDAGLMDRETYIEGLDRQFYAPLQRDMSDKKASLGVSALTGGSSIVKRFRGSDRSIVSPMSVLMHKTFALEQIIAQNDVKKTLALLADKAGAQGALVERVPASTLVGKSYSVKEVAKQLTNDDDISATEAADLMTILQASIDNDNVLNFFRSEQATTKGENITFFWEAGKLQAIQVVDGDLGSDLINLMDGVGRENFQFGVELLTMTSSAFRSAITSWPDFLIVNYIRDQLSAWVLTDVGFKPFVSGLRGVGDELRQNQWSKMYNASMGIMGGMNVAALHEARIKRDIEALRGKGYLAQAFNERGVLGAVKGMANVVELTETGTRLGLFRNAYERGKADGLTDWEAAMEAAYIATDYIDFGLNGNRMLLARRTIPFLNAQLQGLYKMMRTLGGDEVRQRKGLRFVLGAYFKSTRNMELSRTEKAAINTGRKAWVKMVGLGLLSAALHFLYEDDPDYQETSEYMRVTGWVIPMGDGRVFYVPKPFELALIANAVERGLESASGDAEAKNRFMRGLALSMTPPTSPPAIQIAVEQLANYDFFGDREIVPDYMRALSPELQYNNYTSELAKNLGEITGWSPMRIDHFLSGVGASAYRDAVTMTNALDPNRPSMDATDAPILRRFVRDVRRGSASAKDFWKQASMQTGRLREAELSYKTLLEGGNAPAANKILSTFTEDEQAYALLNTHFKTEAKKLNPFYRGRQITTIVSALRREMVSDLGIENTGPAGEPIKLTASRKAQIDEALSEYARREIRNTLIAQQVQGWTGKRRVDVGKTLDMIEGLSPEVREEIERRLAKAKVYSAEAVFEYWPEVKDRVLRDREDAFLNDIISIAKVLK